MPDHWQLLDADAEEAELFADLEHTTRHIDGPAAPPNRYRQVHRVRAGGRTWFLKEFHHTQWKNRLRARLTQPRCELDGEREQRIAEALQQRGIEVARPVASGRRGGTSYYLCAELPGESLRELLDQGRLERRIAVAAARFAGGILAKGVQLPDLASDHVYVLNGSDRFAVIDLHNGSLGDRTSRRTATRILRHFARSVRGVTVRRAAALGFACRLLTAAGLSRTARRRVIERVPPMETHGRYEAPGRSSAYRHRNPRRTERELSLLQRVWPGQPGDLVLDSPAGTGRLATILNERFAVRRIGADRAMAMLREGRAAGNVDFVVQADATALPIGDRGVDGVIVFRFLHHLDARVARTVVDEAARVAGRFVVLSFFHPMSLHAITRRSRQWLTGRARTRFALTHRTLEEWMRELGFAPVAVAAERAYLRDFWVAGFARNPDPC